MIEGSRTIQKWYRQWRNNARYHKRTNCLKEYIGNRQLTGSNMDPNSGSAESTEKC